MGPKPWKVLKSLEEYWSRVTRGGELLPTFLELFVINLSLRGEENVLDAVAEWQEFNVTDWNICDVLLH